MMIATMMAAMMMMAMSMYSKRMRSFFMRVPASHPEPTAGNYRHTGAECNRITSVGYAVLPSSQWNGFSQPPPAPPPAAGCLFGGFLAMPVLT